MLHYILNQNIKNIWNKYFYFTLPLLSLTCWCYLFVCRNAYYWPLVWLYETTCNYCKQSS